MVQVWTFEPSDLMDKKDVLFFDFGQVWATNISQ